MRHHAAYLALHRSSLIFGIDACAALLHTDGGSAVHFTLHHSPLIFGISARAALPEAARGGINGGWLCRLWPLTFLFYVLWKGRGAPANAPGPNHGI